MTLTLVEAVKRLVESFPGNLTEHQKLFLQGCIASFVLVQVEREREACAKLADDLKSGANTVGDWYYGDDVGKAIRARK